MKTKIIAVPANWKQLRPHPLSELIEFGKGVSVEAMAKHMKNHGYDEQEAIVLWEGLILDGRHRLAACKIAGIIPTFREFCGKNAGAYVMKKLHRQYPTIAERAKMAAAYANLPVGANQSNSAPASFDAGAPRLTTSEAAKTFGVSRSSVTRAKAGPTPRKPKPKTGGAIIDWKDFYNHFGALVRAIVSVGKGYQCQHSDVATNLERRLAAFKEEFTKWVEFHTKEKAPRY